jgi:hypothetical protein
VINQSQRKIQTVVKEKYKIIPLCTVSTYGGVEEELHSFLTPAFHEVDWPVSCPGCFTTAEEPLYTH